MLFFLLRCDKIFPNIDVCWQMDLQPKIRNGARMRKKSGFFLVCIFLFFFVPSSFSATFFLKDDFHDDLNSWLNDGIQKSARNFNLLDESNKNGNAFFVDFDPKDDPDDAEDDSDESEKADPDEEDDFDSDKIDPDDEEDDEGEEVQEEESSDEPDADEEEPSDEKEDEESEPEEPEDEEKDDADEDGLDEDLPEENEEEESEGQEENVEEQPEETPLESTLSFCIGLNSIPKSYFGLCWNFDVSYRNYFREQVYWLCGAGLGRGNPNGDYPYSYQVDGANLAAPCFYGTYTYGGLGLIYNNLYRGISVFSEFALGVNFRFLYNNSLKNAHFGKLYTNVLADFSVGASWKWLRASLGVQYDTNWKFVFEGKVGVAIPIEMFRSKK